MMVQINFFFHIVDVNIFSHKVSQSLTLTKPRMHGNYRESRMQLGPIKNRKITHKMLYHCVYCIEEGKKDTYFELEGVCLFSFKIWLYG
jgi:hypothetical protein